MGRKGWVGRDEEVRKRVGVIGWRERVVTHTQRGIMAGKLNGVMPAVTPIGNR